jgi:hypothetical protein
MGLASILVDRARRLSDEDAGEGAGSAEVHGAWFRARLKNAPISHEPAPPVLPEDVAPTLLFAPRMSTVNLSNWS